MRSRKLGSPEQSSNQGAILQVTEAGAPGEGWVQQGGPPRLTSQDLSDPEGLSCLGGRGLDTCLLMSLWEAAPGEEEALSRHPWTRASGYNEV